MDGQIAVGKSNSMSQMVESSHHSNKSVGLKAQWKFKGFHELRLHFRVSTLFLNLNIKTSPDAHLYMWISLCQA